MRVFILKDKDKLIIETAIKLFAQKGFTNTSIQEIANETGISKGAFYLHFKSKDALLLTILDFYYHRLQANIHTYNELDLNSREKFIQQIISMLNTLLNHKEFIIMLTREQALPLNETVKEFIFKIQKNTFEFYQQGLLSIYGRNIEPFLWDLSIILDGILYSYLRILLLDSSEIEIEKLVAFIIKRMDSMVKELDQEETVMTQMKIENLLSRSKSFCFYKEKPTIDDILKQLRQEIEPMDNHDVLLVSLEVVEEEVKKDSPRLPVIQGMLSNFREFPQLEKYRIEIANMYQLKI